MGSRRRCSRRWSPSAPCTTRSTHRRVGYHPSQFHSFILWQRRQFSGWLNHLLSHWHWQPALSEHLKQYSILTDINSLLVYFSLLDLRGLKVQNGILNIHLISSTHLPDDWCCTRHLAFFFKQSKVTDLHKREYYPKWEMYQADSILLEYTDIVLNKVYRFTQRKTLPKKKEQCDSALAEWEMLLAFSFALWRTMAKTWHGSSTPGSKKGFTPLNCLFQVIQMITQVPRSIIWIKKAFTTILGFYSFLPGIVILLVCCSFLVYPLQIVQTRSQELCLWGKIGTQWKESTKHCSTSRRMIRQCVGRPRRSSLSFTGRSVTSHMHTAQGSLLHQL